jgi:hypothetical protein
MKTFMSTAVPESASPTTNTAMAVTRGRFGPTRSAQPPATTMPMTPAARVAENASEYSASPSSSRLIVGMIVVTASASNAPRKMRVVEPIVVHRYCGDSRCGAVLVGRMELFGRRRRSDEAIRSRTGDTGADPAVMEKRQ